MNALGGANYKVNRRMEQASAEVVKVRDKYRATQKKPRFIWTHDVHNCFVDAIKQLRFKRAVPTEILELMNVKDLTRENVASHLQKYRIQEKRRAQKLAQARTDSENVLKVAYPHMSGIPQQPCVIPNTMQGINMDCAFLDGSQLAPSFANHNLNMIQAFGTPFEDLFDGGVNRMSCVRLVDGLYDNNGPHDINKIGYNYGPLPPKPLVDSYAHNLMDRHDTTLVPQYDRRDELSLQGIINPFVPQYDRRDELSLQGIISPSFVSQYDQRDELSLQDIISPSFVLQYDRRNELFVADQGSISPLLAQNMERLGVGVPRLPEAIEGLIGMKVEGIEVGMPRLPTGVLGMKVGGLELGVPCLPEATGGLAGMKFKGHVPRLPEATGGLAGMKVEGLGAGVTHLTEATGGYEEQESVHEVIDFCMNMKWELDDLWEV